MSIPIGVDTLFISLYDKVKLPNLNLRMPSFSRKKLLLIGFLFVILLVIPITVYLVRQQALQSKPIPNTTLSFVPSDQTASVGTKVNFEIWVSPGNNQVGFIKLVVKYDSTKLSATEDSFSLNPASNLSVIEGPVIGAAGDELSVNLSVDPAEVIKQDTKIGDITFDVISSSVTPSEIAFDDTKVEIKSISGTKQDAGENIFLSATPATVTFQETEEIEPTLAPQVSTPAAALSPAPVSTDSAGAFAAGNLPPVCESLITDRSTDGTAPLSIVFTANGLDTDGTVNKATFSFGEGTVEDVTTGGGIGTNAVNIQKPFTYNNEGNFTASVLLTDSSGGVSSSSASCAVSILVSGISAGGIESSESAQITPLPPTGPTQIIIGLGILGGVLFLIGALLFFAL